MLTSKEILKIRESSQLLDVIAELADKVVELESNVTMLINKSLEKKAKGFFDFDEETA